MTTFVALLRAVNVGTANRMKMDRLRAAFADAGYPDAVTHIQSGNVIFSSRQSAAVVASSVEALILAEFDLTITAIVRSSRQLIAVTRANPFLPAGGDISSLHVAFLAAKPTISAVEAFDAAALTAGDDQVRLCGTEVFIRYAHGAGTSKLTASVWKRLGESTVRNWAVTLKLAELAGSHGSL